MEILGIKLETSTIKEVITKFFPDIDSVPHSVWCGERALELLADSVEQLTNKCMFEFSKTYGLPVYRDLNMDKDVIEIRNRNDEVLNRFIIV